MKTEKPAVKSHAERYGTTGNRAVTYVPTEMMELIDRYAEAKEVSRAEAIRVLIHYGLYNAPRMEEQELEDGKLITLPITYRQALILNAFARVFTDGDNTLAMAMLVDEAFISLVKTIRDFLNEDKQDESEK